MNPNDWVWKNYDRWKTTPPEYAFDEDEDYDDDGPYEPAEDDEDDQ